jgi:IMP dehydrogenase
MFTFKDIEKVRKYPHAAKDARGRLLCAAAVGVGPEGEERAEALVAAGRRPAGIDSAHGHSAGILEFAAKLKDRHPDVALMVGNVATGDAVRACADHGADIVKVGVGPGSICTTRVVTGVGMPQFTAVLECARAADEVGVATVADGGVRYSGDVVKALAAGATAVMVGNLLAGTDESPGELVLVGGRRYKEYRGMGSIDAMRAGSADRYFQDDRRPAAPPRPPALQAGARGRVRAAALPRHRSARSPPAARGRAAVRHGLPRCPDLRRSPSGPGSSADRRRRRESHVHDLDVVHEAPNYQVPGKG